MTQATHKHEDIGVVTSIQYPIVEATGLSDAHPRELVHFEEGGFGQIVSLRENSTSIMAFSKTIPRIGSGIVREGHKLSIHLCEDILGATIDALGNHLSEVKHCTHEKEFREIDIPPVALAQRAPIDQTLHCGVALSDLLLPLGRGQRELVVGDRKTGKSTYLLQVAKAQIEQGAVCVYAMIGKKSNEIKQLLETVETLGLKDSMTVVVSRANDTPSTIVMTPFTAMTIAEYLRDQGKHVVVFLDDLSTHAKYYREVALLSHQFPGRDSYPGDIFYTHARLLERAGNFSIDKKKTASITCLPVVETHEGELTDFIVSNLISITDGHLFFQSDLFSRGMRPAIHTGLSVTRVGKQTQTPLGRDLNYTLGLFLTQYEKTRDLLHFGAELNEHTKAIIDRGNSLFAFFNQNKRSVLPLTVELLFASFIFSDWFIGKKDDEIIAARDQLLKVYTTNARAKKLLDEFAKAKNYKELAVSMEPQKEQLLSLCQA